ncbi:hypothetical protein Tco_0575147 [Tanacetum coccineum]
MRHSIEVGPYERKMIQNPDKPDDPTTKIIEPLSKMTESNKKQYFSDIRVMNYLFQGIPNDIYYSVDACKTAKQIWFDTLSQYEPHVITSRAKKAARNHDPLALVAHLNVYPSHSRLNAVVILIACIQPTDDKADAEPTSDVDALCEVNASQIHLKSRMNSKRVHEHTNHVKLKTTINTSDDDQIDIFDDPYMENNSGEDEHNSNAYDQSVTLNSLIQNIQKEAKNQRSLNNELKKQKALLKRKLETCKKRVKTLEKQPVKSWNYKEAYQELEREIHIDKDKINNIIK